MKNGNKKMGHTIIQQAKKFSQKDDYYPEFSSLTKDVFDIYNCY